MEKIQQAIARARQERNTRVRQVAAPVAFEGSLAVDLEACPRFTLDRADALRHRLVAAVPDDPRGDLFRMLRTQLRQRLGVIGGRSVAVFSARDGEGKTMVASNLALSLARQDEAPVFLLDFDFRRPSVHSVFGLEVGQGLSAFIEGRAPLVDVMHRMADLPLYVLPQGRPHPAASELIAAAPTRALLEALRDQSTGSTIVVDCSPLLLTDEPLTVQQMVDASLLVVQQNRTRRADVQRASELIDEAKYVGSVMNHVDESDLAEAYGYGYR